MSTPERRLGARSLLRPHIVVLIGIAAIVAVTFAVIIAALNRGFDWSDEGFVLAMDASGRVSTNEPFGFQYLLHPIYELFGSSVLAFRILRLLGYVALGVVLTLLARATLRSRGIELGRAGWILVGLVAQVGTFAAWSYPPRYLGYNELSSWFTQLGAGLVIFLLLDGRANRGGRSVRRGWLWAIAGVVLSFLVVAKISSGVFLTAIAVVAAIVAIDASSWWKRLASLAAGLAGGCVLMVLTGVPLLTYLSSSARFGTDPMAQTESGYSVSALLFTYITSLTVTLGALGVPILLAGLLLLVVRGFGSEGGVARGFVTAMEHVALFFAFVLVVLVVAIVVIPGSFDTWTSLGFSNAFLLTIALLTFAVIATPGERAAGTSRGRGIAAASFAIGLFALAPLISALGTNNPIFGATVFSATIWAVGAAVGLVVLWQRSRALSVVVRLVPVLLLGVIVATSVLGVAGDVLLHPYRTAAYFAQKSPVEVGDLRGMRLTEGEAELATWLHDTAGELDAADVPTLSIARPGALFAFNSSGWSAIWPGATWAASIEQSCTDDPPKDLIVLQSNADVEGQPGHDRLVEGLAACGIDFPGDFEVVKRHPSHDPVEDVRVWRLR